MNKFKTSTPASTPSHGREKPFLHVKFGDGRPPEFAATLRFAYQIALAHTELNDSLKTDVQREGVGRYLVNNFKQGPVHDVVHERERDEGSYLLLTNNWHRSAGDSKLHLSLYVYKDDRHVETWHVYTDRTLSLSGGPNTRPTGTAAYETPDAVKEHRPSYQPKPSRADEETPRPRLDRPAVAPPDSPVVDIPPSKLPTSTRLVPEEEEEDDDREEVIPPVPVDRSARNPHARAPPVSTVPPATTRPTPSNPKADPAPPSPTGWDAPPPEDDGRPHHDEWVNPPEEDWEKPPPPAPEEGFEKLFRAKTLKKAAEKELEHVEEFVEDHLPKRGREDRPTSRAPPSRNGSPESSAPPTRHPPALYSSRHDRSPARSPSPPPRSSRQFRKPRSPSRSPSPPPRTRRAASPPPTDRRSRDPLPPRSPSPESPAPLPKSGRPRSVREPTPPPDRGESPPPESRGRRSAPPPSRSTYEDDEEDEEYRREVQRETQVRKEQDERSQRDAELQREEKAAERRRAERDAERKREEREAERRRQEREAERLREEEEIEREREERRRKRREADEREAEEERAREKRRQERRRQIEEEDRLEKERLRAKRSARNTDVDTDVEDKPQPSRRPTRGREQDTNAEDRTKPRRSASVASTRRRHREDSRSPSPPPPSRSTRRSDPSRADVEVPPRSKSRLDDASEDDVSQRPVVRKPEPSATLSPTSPDSGPTFRSVRRSSFHGEVDSERDQEGDGADAGRNSPSSKRERGSRHRQDTSFDPSKLDPSRNIVSENAPPVATKAAALGSWFKGIGDIIKQTTGATKAPEEAEEELEEEYDSEEERRRAEKAERRAARRKRREERAKRAAAATDAEQTEAEDLPGRRRSRREVETDGERTDIEEPAKERRSRRDDDHDQREERRKKSQATDVESEDDRPTHISKPQQRAELEDGSSRRAPASKRTDLDPEDAPPRRPRPSRSHTDVDTDYEERPRSARREKRSGHETEAEDIVPRHVEAQEEEKEETPASRPPLRQRALSFSASVDAGLRGLREAVVSKVQAAATKPAAVVPPTVDLPVDPPRPKERARKERRDDFEAEDARPSRGSRRGTMTDNDEEAPKIRDRRPVRQPREQDEEEVNAPEKRSTRRSRVADDTSGDETDGPRSGRRRHHSDSERETEMDKVAKANANVNSSTIPLEVIAASKRVPSPMPSSPSSQHPISVREELRQKALQQSTANGSLPPSRANRTPISEPTPHTTSRSSHTILDDVVKGAARFTEDVVEDVRGLGSGKKYPSPPPSERNSENEEKYPSPFNRQALPRGSRSSRGFSNQFGNGGGRDFLGNRNLRPPNEVPVASSQSAFSRSAPNSPRSTTRDDTLTDEDRSIFNSSRHSRPPSPTPSLPFIEENRMPLRSAPARRYSSDEDDDAPASDVPPSKSMPLSTSRASSASDARERPLPSSEGFGHSGYASLPSSSRRSGPLDSTSRGKSAPSSQSYLGDPVPSSRPRGPPPLGRYHEFSDDDEESFSAPLPRTTVGSGATSFRSDGQSALDVTRGSVSAFPARSSATYPDTDDDGPLPPSRVVYPETDDEEFVPKPSRTDVKASDFEPRSSRYQDTDEDDDDYVSRGGFGETDDEYQARGGYPDTDDDGPSRRNPPPRTGARPLHNREPSFSRSTPVYSLDDSEYDEPSRPTYASSSGARTSTTSRSLDPNPNGKGLFGRGQPHSAPPELQVDPADSTSDSDSEQDLYKMPKNYRPPPSSSTERREFATDSSASRGAGRLLGRSDDRIRDRPSSGSDYGYSGSRPFNTVEERTPSSSGTRMSRAGGAGERGSVARGRYEDDSPVMSLRAMRRAGGGR